MNRFDLEERLISFAVSTLELVDSLPANRTCNYLGSQLERSCTSPALNYGEAQFAESKNDFIHKIKISLKELKETKINLIIISRRNYVQNAALLENVMKENIGLINIFTKSAKTASSNRSKK